MYQFGDYVLIEQKRYVGKNEMFLYKVVAGNMKCNRYRRVPVDGRDNEETLGEMSEVIKAICCGVDERKVEVFRVCDVKPNIAFRNQQELNERNKKA